MARFQPLSRCSLILAAREQAPALFRRRSALPASVRSHVFGSFSWSVITWHHCRSRRLRTSRTSPSRETSRSSPSWRASPTSWLSCGMTPTRALCHPYSAGHRRRCGQGLSPRRVQGGHIAGIAAGKGAGKGAEIGVAPDLPAVSQSTSSSTLTTTRTEALMQSLPTFPASPADGNTH